MPIFQAIAILSLLHGLLCFAIGGIYGLKQTAIFAVSAAGCAHLSGAKSLAALFSWFRSYESQFRIWLGCTLVMGLFIFYRTMPRLDAAFLEFMSVASFFMFMVSLGNRILK